MGFFLCKAINSHVIRMVLFRDVIRADTEKGVSFLDITERVASLVKACKIKEGVCNIFVPATTAGIMINENDRMLIEDFRRSFAAIDEKKIYSHMDNAFSHLRANMLSAERTIPVSGGTMLLGQRQSILLWEFDKNPRKREIIVSVIGD